MENGKERIADALDVMELSDDVLDQVTGGIRKVYKDGYDPTPTFPHTDPLQLDTSRSQKYQQEDLMNPSTVISEELAVSKDPSDFAINLAPTPNVYNINSTGCHMTTKTLSDSL